MSSQQPKVSVIIPNYNHGEFIGAAIQSVLDQTYPNIEVIIVDNYSQDHSLEIIRAFKDKRVQVFQFNNQGIIAAARNYGVKQATGELIAFLDADDIWDQEKLALQCPYLEDPLIAAVSTHFIPIGQTRYYHNHLAELKDSPHRLFNFHEMCRANKVMTSSLLMRKADFERLGGFDESSDFAFIEDWELWLRLSHDIGPICVLNAPLLQYRIIKKKNRDIRQVKLNMLKIAEKLKGLKYLDEQQYQNMCVFCYPGIAAAHLEVGDKLAFKYYKLVFFSYAERAMKYKAIIGMILAFFPKKLLKTMIEGRYYLRNQLTVNIKRIFK